MADKPIDVIHFHRQGTAYRSLKLMARVPAIVSIDATQDIMIDAAPSHFEKWSYGPNATIDGRVFRAAKAIVSTSQWTADCLHRRYPGCRTPVHVMPVPVRLRSFESRWIEERRIRAGGPRLSAARCVHRPRFHSQGGTGAAAARGVTAVSTNRVLLDIVTNWPVPPRTCQASTSYTASPLFT